MTKAKPPYPFLLHKLLELSSLDLPKDISFGINNVSMDSDRYLCIVDQCGINQNVQIVELMTSDKPIESIFQDQLPTAQSMGNLKNYDMSEHFNLAGELQKFEIQKSQSSPSPFTENPAHSNHFSASLSPVIHPSALVSLSKSIVTNVKHLIDNEVTSSSTGNINSNEISDHEPLPLVFSDSPSLLSQWPIKVHGRWQILANDTVLAHKTSLTAPSMRSTLPCFEQSKIDKANLTVEEPFECNNNNNNEEANTTGDMGDCCTVAIKAAFNIQLFDLRKESRIKTLKMNEGIRYWKFLDDSTIILVSNFQVYQWNIASDDYPVKLFVLLEELQTSQVMNIKIDVNKKFAALFSISAHENKVVGHIQLYSFTHKVSKLLFGFAGDFYTHDVALVCGQSPDDHDDIELDHKSHSDSKREGLTATFSFLSHKLKRKSKKVLTIFCYSNKMNNIISVERKILNKHFFTHKAGHSKGSANPSPKKVGSKLKSYLDEVLNFKYSATEFELTSARLKDFPVSLFVLENLALLFLVTKMGYCSIIELFSGNFIYEQKVSPQTVFLTTPVHSLYPSYYSFITINRDGRVVAVVLNIKELVNVVIENTRNFSLGLSLLHRDRSLEVSLEYVLREFLHLLSLRKFKEAADLIVLKNTKSSLRRLEIINKFLECDAHDKITPVHYYFHAILNSYPYLLHFEAVALVQEIMKFQNRTVAIKALDHWFSYGKLRPSQDIANLIKSIHPELASKIESRNDQQSIDFYDPSAPISDFSPSLLSRLEEELAREKEKKEEKRETKEVEFSDFILSSHSESQPHHGKESSSPIEEFDLFKQFR